MEGDEVTQFTDGLQAASGGHGRWNRLVQELAHSLGLDDSRKRWWSALRKAEGTCDGVPVELLVDEEIGGLNPARHLSDVASHRRSHFFVRAKAAHRPLAAEEVTITCARPDELTLAEGTSVDFQTRTTARALAWYSLRDLPPPDIDRKLMVFAAEDPPVDLGLEYGHKLRAVGPAERLRTVLDGELLGQLAVFFDRLPTAVVHRDHISMTLGPVSGLESEEENAQAVRAMAAMAGRISERMARSGE